ncbi:MAG: beta-lactamase family protein [Firmicutes bacterium]|nr:beta-lactamase family protein [Bacillota bacterium]
MKKVTAILVLLPLCVLTVFPAYAAQSGRLYGIGSVSKVFTAAGVMKLAEEGKVDLDAPLTAYIPEFTMADARYAQITPRMLLNHSSGLMGTTGNNGFLLGDNDTYYHDHLLGFLKSQKLKHDPGERSIYCNDGFTLAEILIERVSGISFTEFIERNFSGPLGLTNIRTPQSDFDRSLLADSYMGNKELQPENVGLIGSGGIYATMEDLCRFAAIFMDSADGSLLSKRSADEMAKNQHKKEMVSLDADTVVRYGLGWDAVEEYPFAQYGIKALSKGGTTDAYHTNLTVLPAYDLAVAVSASGKGGQEQLIAQEIILAVLQEEGLIPGDAVIAMPVVNLERAKVPESVKAYAGVYDAGGGGLMHIEFTQDALIFTPILVKNERAQEYLYNTDGEFVSTNGDYLGLGTLTEGARGITKLRFAEDKYLMVQTYVDMPGLSLSAFAMPLAEKLEVNAVSEGAAAAWKARNGKEYLLVSEKYTSVQYAGSPIAKTLTDERVRGYVCKGIYKGGGADFASAKIVDAATALGFQSTPTMMGRDTNNLTVTKQKEFEYLAINNFRYIDAAAALKFFEMGETVVLGAETVWVDIDDAGGRCVQIVTPQNGAWFAYDDKMNCVATSLEKYPRDTIVLPDHGRLAFAGEAGATFIVK